MWYALLLAADPPSTEGGPPFLVGMMPILLMVVLGYFLLWLPARRQEKQRQVLVSALKRNDKIVNSGGIIGIVESIKDKEDEVVLKGGLRVTRSSIVRIVNSDESTKE